MQGVELQMVSIVYAGFDVIVFGDIIKVDVPDPVQLKLLSTN